MAIATTCAVAAAIAVLPWIERRPSTVSAADADGSHRETRVTSRVAGRVEEVLVDLNKAVRKGELLVRLDREPYRLELDARQAAVTAAEADLALAEAESRGLEALARSQRWKLQAAVEQVRNDVAALKAAAATLRSREAARDKADADFKRVGPLVRGRTISTEEFDQREADLQVANAAADSARYQVLQLRAALGLPSGPKNGDLADVPDNWEIKASNVRSALADVVCALAKLGIASPSGEPTPDELIQEFRRRDEQGDAEENLAKIVANAPQVKRARAQLNKARCELERAKFGLRHCDVLAETDGVITRREVEIGSHVQPGQSLMTIRR